MRLGGTACGAFADGFEVFADLGFEGFGLLRHACGEAHALDGIVEAGEVRLIDFDCFEAQALESLGEAHGVFLDDDQFGAKAQNDLEIRLEEGPDTRLFLGVGWIVAVLRDAHDFIAEAEGVEDFGGGRGGGYNPPRSREKEQECE